MGRIDRIELENFKTYRGRHVVGPLANFTCIIGPNGSGKSNIMDAISFVLGIRAGALRGKELRDLIFRAKDEPESTRRRASVRLVFVVGDGEVEGMSAGDELSFGRTISPSGTSTYRVNDRAVPRTEYDEVLASIGVVARGTNCLVAQGTVASLGSRTPQDMLQLFEEVAGSADLIDEYEDKSATMLDAQETTIQMYQRKKDILAEKREAKSQKDEADKFDRKLKAKEDLTREYYRWQLFHIESSIRKHEHAKEELAEERDRFVEEENSLAAELEEKVAEYRKLTKQVGTLTKKREKEAKAQQKAADKVTEAEAELGDCKSGIKKCKADLKKAEAKVAKQARDEEGLEAKIAKVNKEIAGLDETKGDDGEQGGHLEEYLELKRQATSTAAAASEAYDKVVALQTTDRNHLESLENEAVGLQRDIEDTKGTVAENTRQREKARQGITKREREFAEAKQERKELAEQAADDQARFAAVDAELQKINKRLRSAKDARQRTERETRQVEVLEQMKRRIPGVRGRLVDLCRPTSKKYEMAVTRVLGKLAEAIVVDTAKTGWEVISHLRTEKVGAADVLPLDSVRVTAIPAALRSLGGGYKVAYDVIAAEDDVKKAVQHVCGDAVICENMERARELRFGRGSRKVKAVTLAGGVIARNGNMTGGNSRQDRGGVSHWARAEVEEARELKERLQEEHQRLKRVLRYSGKGSRAHRLKELNNDVDRLTRTLASLEGHVKVLSEKIDEDKQNLDAKQRELQRKQAPMDTYRTNIANREAEVARRRRAKDRAEADVFADFCTRLGISSISEYVEGDMKRSEARRKQRLDLTSSKAKLEQQLNYVVSNKSHKEKEAKARKLLKSEERQLQKCEHKLQEALAKQDKAQTKTKELQQQVDDKEAALKATKAEVEAARQAKSSVVKKRQKSEKAVADEDLKLEKARGARHDFVSRARDEEVKFPMKDGEMRVLNAQPRDDEDEDVDMSQDAESQASSRTSQRTSRYSQSNASAVKRDGRRIQEVDFSGLRGRAIDNEVEFDEMRRDFEKRLQTLATELSAMQPNMKAVERYKDVAAKLVEAEEALNTAKAKARQAVEEFEQVKEKRTKMFTEAFESVAQSVDGVYKAMTASAKHPQGGSAYLGLTNESEPFEGGVSYTTIPPTKVFRKLGDMSGGEQAIAALCLLFAIHAFKRAPFFVLDEIDGNLDKMNVAKVVNYVSRRTRDTESPVQCLVISLKSSFFERGDRLVGVCKDVKSSGSRIITLDLTPYHGTLIPDEMEAAPTPARRKSGAGAGAGSGSARRKSAATPPSGGAGAASSVSPPGTAPTAARRSKHSGSGGGKRSTPASGTSSKSRRKRRTSAPSGSGRRASRGSKKRTAAAAMDE